MKSSLAVFLLPLVFLCSFYYTKVALLGNFLWFLENFYHEWVLKFAVLFLHLLVSTGCRWGYGGTTPLLRSTEQDRGLALWTPPSSWPSVSHQCFHFTNQGVTSQQRSRTKTLEFRAEQRKRWGWGGSESRHRPKISIPVICEHKLSQVWATFLTGAQTPGLCVGVEEAIKIMCPVSGGRCMFRFISYCDTKGHMRKCPEADSVTYAVTTL